MSKLADEEVKGWLTRGFALGPYAFGNQLGKQLRREIPFTGFSIEMKKQLFMLAKPLPQSTIAWLYETCLQARVQRDVVVLAKGFVRKKSWNQAKQRTVKLLKLLDDFPSNDLESMLRKALNSRKGVRLRNKAAELAHNIRELNYQCERWKHFANWGSWQEDYRSYLLGMDRHLQRRCPGLLGLKQRRVEVIRLALEMLGINDVSEDGISQALYRETERKKLLRPT
jgi:hypothetical protein